MIRYFKLLLIILISVNAEISFSQEIVDPAQDEFLALEKSNSSEDDEFLSLDESNTLTDEEFGDFEEFEQFEEQEDGHHCGAGCGSENKNSQLWWVLSILGITGIAGIMIRFRSTRNLRGVFLIASLVILGFYKGGCPCPIMSLHHTLMGAIGLGFNWVGMIWFLGLIPVTYFFGKVWCGWVCHLGALQEFINLPGKINILRSEKAQKIMRYIRIVLLVLLIAQIVITKTNLFKSVDPFKVAFNLRSAHLSGWILLGLLLISSVFIYRPFCKSICPIGLILGWVSKIPGASIISPKISCVSCSNCNTSCKINAITRDKKVSILDNQECIACGDCISSCRKDSLGFVKNSKHNPSKVVCGKK